MPEFRELEHDPWCDENNPRTVEFEQISAAAYRIRDGIVRTPCDVSPSVTTRSKAKFSPILANFYFEPMWWRRS